MFERVVVGIDDYEAGRDALELANRLVSLRGSLLLVYVEVVMAAPGPDSDPRWQLDDRQRALERLASIRDDVGVDAELLTVQAGSVAGGLHEAVRRHGDLLVIGASKRDEFERTFVGDDTRQVLQDAPCAVAVAPMGYAARARTPDTIGVAYDGSPHSGRALAAASELAREVEAELSAFEAVPEPMYVTDPVNGQVALEHRLAKAREQLAALEGVKPRVGSGDTVEALTRYGASVDLLVLGGHEYRLRDRLSGGSTAQRLADGVSSPLLVLAA
jgi:nucleotide-binding universal stress UspA family protein